MNWRLLEQDAELRELVDAHREVAFVAVDTEFMRRDTFYPQAALVQLCFPNETQAQLIDPVRIDDLAPLKDLFANAAITKVLHSAGEDLEVFMRALGALPIPLFDSQRAAAYLNLGHGLGYRALVKLFTGEELPKGETRSNWLARPLTESQLRYAAQDVAPLAAIYGPLNARLSAAGKLEWLMQDGDNAVQAAAEPRIVPVSRIKAAWKLNARQLAVLIAVCDWRERRAQILNKPRSWILSDVHCLQLAQCCPQAPADFGKIAGFPAAVVRTQGAQLLQVVGRALEIPECELPARLPAPLDALQRNRLKRLKSRVGAYARKWDIAPEILLNSKDYELLLRKCNGETVAEPPYWQGWRRLSLFEPLLREFGVASA